MFIHTSSCSAAAEQTHPEVKLTEQGALPEYIESMSVAPSGGNNMFPNCFQAAGLPTMYVQTLKGQFTSGTTISYCIVVWDTVCVQSVF